MRKVMLLVAVLGLAVSLWAASPFDGTWKIDLNKVQLPDKPQTMMIQNGMYQCSTCDPKINIKADGTDQPIAGSKTADTVSVKVVDDKTVEVIDKKGGKVLSSSKATVSADGKMFTVESINYPEGKQPVTVKETFIRVAAGPAGSHAFSGSWKIHKVNIGPENTLTITYKSSSNGLMMSVPAFGITYDANFDGKDYPIKGDPSATTVSLTKVNDRSFDETTKSDGKIVSVNHVTVSADGKTMSVKSASKVQGTTATFTAIKQ
jgi:hypothetical protein